MSDAGNTLKLALFIALGLLTAGYFCWWARCRFDRQAPDSAPCGLRQVVTGFGTNFFDTLGIGSFATTTVAYRLMRLVRDEVIPGTMNVGHTPPTAAQAFIFMAVIAIDPLLLVSSIIAAMVGAWFGAGIVAGLSRRRIQIGMGSALLMAALLMLLSQASLFSAAGAASGVSTAQLLIMTAANFLLGVVGTLGIGSYAPTLALFSLLGMDPRAAFPMMMGAAAFSMIASGLRFLSARSYDQGAALGLTLGGIPAVLLAAFVVKSLPLSAIRWLVVVVIVYTAVTMLRSARAERQSGLPAFATGATLPEYLISPSAEK